MKKFISAAVFVLLISASFYSQDNCKAEDKERAKLIAQKLEEYNFLRMAIEREEFGDCVHYAWMDEMRKLGVKQVDASLDFVWNDKIEQLEITKMSFLQTYYRLDTGLKDKKLLEQIESSGLKKQFEAAILERAKKDVLILIESLKRNYKEGLLKNEPKGKISGTIYQNLLDDESLPVLVDMPTVDY
jgi:hypothetical protein